METIKEEKKADLEQLLNSLIEKGWKPWNKEEVKRLNYHTLYREVVSLEFENYNLGVSYSIRDLVSKESGLWQFVCENGMIKHDQYTNTTRIQEYEDERDSETYRTKYDEGSYLFRLIESSLKDESELEDFLLSNIKVDD